MTQQVQACGAEFKSSVLTKKLGKAIESTITLVLQVLEAGG